MPALVIEGGGMKAAYANGVLSAFEEAHLSWDAIFGTSAGGILGAWYSAGQARYAEGTWPFARDPRVLNYRRAALRRGPLLDHGLLIDTIYTREHPLDLDAVAAAPWPIVVTAADVDTGTAVYHDVRRGPILAWLKATGRLPFASGPPVEIDGRRYVDGGVIDPIPIAHAVAEGHRDVVLILNQPPGTSARDAKLVLKWAARRYPAIADGILRHKEIKQAAVAFAKDPPPGVRVRIIHPPVHTGVSRLSRDMDAIERIISLGRQAGAAHVAQLRRA